MNRGLVLVALVILIGYYFKQSSLENYKNIYTSNFTKEAQETIENELGKRYTESLNPTFTGVYNPIVSSYGADALEKDTNELQKQFNDIRYKNIREPERELKGEDIQIDLVEDKETGQKKRKRAIPAMDGDFFTYNNNASDISAMTGLPIELNPDVQPFFSKKTQNVENFDSGRLDHKLGNSLSFRKKDAVEKFTHGYTVPNANMSQVVYTDHVDKNRFIPSIYHEGVPVIQPELMGAPIAGTFDNKIQYKTGEKTLEELRPIHTKESYHLPEVQGVNPVNFKRGDFGDTTKEKRKTFRENTQDDYFKGPGGYIAHKAEERFNVKDTDKVSYADREGGAKGYSNPESRFNKDGYRQVAKESYQPILANATGTNKVMMGELTNYASVGTHRETLEKRPIGNPNKASKGIVIPQITTLHTLREDLSAKPLTNARGPHTNSLNEMRQSGLLGYNAQTTTKELGLKGYTGGMQKEQHGNYLTESYDPRTTLKELILNKDRVGIAMDTKRGTMNYEGNDNYESEKAKIKEEMMQNRTPNKSSQLGNGNISIGNATLKEYINRPQPIYYKGPDIITGVDNIGTRVSSDKVVGVNRFQPMKSNEIQDFDRIESTIHVK